MPQQTPAELREHLQEQVGFLVRSARDFDNGEASEAKRLAHHMRLLLHHRPASNSHALLAQLGVLNTMEFLDTAGPVNPRNLATSWNLNVLVFNNAGTRYEPRRDAEGPWVAWYGFQMWWEMEVVKDDQGETFSRSDLVLAVANKDGGSHVDPRLRGAYARLSRNNSLGWVHVDGTGQQQPFGNPVPAAIRQVTYELLLSLERAVPELSQRSP